jgi:hypothetical protein
VERSALGGVAYFAIVFVAGFALGTVRVLVLEPRLGELAAGLTELPFILAIAWLTCGWVLLRFRVPPRNGARLLMGAVAFGLLILAEVVLSSLLFGRTSSEFLGSLTTPQGAIGLAGQALFGLMPLIRRHAPGSFV